MRRRLELLLQLHLEAVRSFHHHKPHRNNKQGGNKKQQQQQQRAKNYAGTRFNQKFMRQENWEEQLPSAFSRSSPSSASPTDPRLQAHRSHRQNLNRMMKGRALRDEHLGQQHPSQNVGKAVNASSKVQDTSIVQESGHKLLSSLLHREQQAKHRLEKKKNEKDGQEGKAADKNSRKNKKKSSVEDDALDGNVLLRAKELFERGSTSQQQLHRRRNGGEKSRMEMEREKKQLLRRRQQARKVKRISAAQRGTGAVTSSATKTHPCLLQTANRTCPDPETCPYVHFPANVCLQELKFGRCREHEERGTCPWVHQSQRSSHSTAHHPISEEQDSSLTSMLDGADAAGHVKVTDQIPHLAAESIMALVSFYQLQGVGPHEANARLQMTRDDAIATLKELFVEKIKTSDAFAEQLEMLVVIAPPLEAQDENASVLNEVEDDGHASHTETVLTAADDEFDALMKEFSQPSGGVGEGGGLGREELPWGGYDDDVGEVSNEMDSHNSSTENQPMVNDGIVDNVDDRYTNALLNERLSKQVVGEDAASSAAEAAAEATMSLTAAKILAAPDLPQVLDEEADRLLDFIQRHATLRHILDFTAGGKVYLCTPLSRMIVEQCGTDLSHTNDFGSWVSNLAIAKHAAAAAVELSKATSVEIAAIEEWSTDDDGHQIAFVSALLSPMFQSIVRHSFEAVTGCCDNMSSAPNWQKEHAALGPFMMLPHLLNAIQFLSVYSVPRPTLAVEHAEDNVSCSPLSKEVLEWGAKGLPKFLAASARGNAIRTLVEACRDEHDEDELLLDALSVEHRFDAEWSTWCLFVNSLFLSTNAFSDMTVYSINTTTPQSWSLLDNHRTVVQLTTTIAKHLESTYRRPLCDAKGITRRVQLQQEELEASNTPGEAGASALASYTTRFFNPWTIDQSSSGNVENGRSSSSSGNAATDADVLYFNRYIECAFSTRVLNTLVIHLSTFVPELHCRLPFGSTQLVLPSATAGSMFSSYSREEQQKFAKNLLDSWSQQGSTTRNFEAVARANLFILDQLGVVGTRSSAVVERARTVEESRSNALLEARLAAVSSEAYKKRLHAEHTKRGDIPWKQAPVIRRILTPATPSVDGATMALVLRSVRFLKPAMAFKLALTMLNSHIILKQVHQAPDPYLIQIQKRAPRRMRQRKTGKKIIRKVTVEYEKVVNEGERILSDRDIDLHRRRQKLHYSMNADAVAEMLEIFAVYLPDNGKRVWQFLSNGGILAFDRYGMPSNDAAIMDPNKALFSTAPTVDGRATMITSRKRTVGGPTSSVADVILPNAACTEVILRNYVKTEEELLSLAKQCCVGRAMERSRLHHQVFFSPSCSQLVAPKPSQNVFHIPGCEHGPLGVGIAARLLSTTDSPAPVAKVGKLQLGAFFAATLCSVSMASANVLLKSLQRCATADETKKPSQGSSSGDEDVPSPVSERENDLRDMSSKVSSRAEFEEWFQVAAKNSPDGAINPLSAWNTIGSFVASSTTPATTTSSALRQDIAVLLSSFGGHQTWVSLANQQQERQAPPMCTNLSIELGLTYLLSSPLVWPSDVGHSEHSSSSKEGGSRKEVEGSLAKRLHVDPAYLLASKNSSFLDDSARRHPTAKLWDLLRSCVLDQTSGMMKRGGSSVLSQTPLAPLEAMYGESSPQARNLVIATIGNEKAFAALSLRFMFVFEKAVKQMVSERREERSAARSSTSSSSSSFGKQHELPEELCIDLYILLSFVWMCKLGSTTNATPSATAAAQAGTVKLLEESNALLSYEQRTALSQLTEPLVSSAQAYSPLTAQAVRRMSDLLQQWVEGELRHVKAVQHRKDTQLSGIARQQQQDQSRLVAFDDSGDYVEALEHLSLCIRTVKNVLAVAEK